MGARNRYYNPFSIAVGKRPNPAANQMSFPYNFSLKDYDISSFNASKFRDSVQLSEVEQVKNDLRNAVSMYEVRYGGDPLATPVFCVFFLIGVVISASLLAAGFGGISMIGFGVGVVLGWLAIALIRNRYQKKLEKR